MLSRKGYENNLEKYITDEANSAYDFTSSKLFLYIPSMDVDGFPFAIIFGVI